MLTRLGYRIHTALERTFPEKRIYVKSGNDARFIRLRPITQIFAAFGLAIAVCWSVFASAVVLVEAIGTGPSRDQTALQQSLYEERLTSLGHDRDNRTNEAARAQERFNLALRQVAEMQTRLLASEDRRRELETGVDVIQNTLRRTIEERDAFKTALSDVLDQNTGARGTSQAALSQEAIAVAETLALALGETAQQRDDSDALADEVIEQIAEFERIKRADRARNEEIFARLEEAVAASIAPLEKMFKSADLDADKLLRTIRNNYSGQGGPISPLIVTPGGYEGHEDETRVNAILRGLDQVALYRLAALKTPFAIPVKGAYRQTSGFGHRTDPITGGKRMHRGTDFAGPRGLPIIATADGTVVFAGRQSGYGNIIKISHENNTETFYAHLSKIRVKKGERVSRGDHIGDMGSTGRSTGTHLHYEVRIDGKPVNAMRFIKAARDVF